MSSASPARRPSEQRTTAFRQSRRRAPGGVSASLRAAGGPGRSRGRRERGQPLRPHPRRARAHVTVVAGGAAAADDHTAAVEQVRGRGYGVAARALRHDARVAALTEHVPEAPAKARAPLTHRLMAPHVGDVRQPAPVLGLVPAPGSPGAARTGGGRRPSPPPPPRPARGRTGGTSTPSVREASADSVDRGARGRRSGVGHERGRPWAQYLRARRALATVSPMRAIGSGSVIS